MALLPHQIYKIAKSYANYAVDEKIRTLVKLYNQEKKDGLISLLLSKASNFSDKIKVIYCTYFLINYPKMSPNNILQIINNLYVLTVEEYEDEKRILETCPECGGDGYQYCSYCEGDGKIDCKYCDGEGEIECSECDGSGTEDCRFCGGDGTETDYEEDDDGEEVEVEVDCTSCEGSGKESCRGCGGNGEFECPECEGSGTENCSNCDGYGTESCDYCGGSGDIESDDYHYEINKIQMIVVGSSLKKFEDEIMDLGDYRNLEANEKSFDWSLEINDYSYEDDITSEDRRDTAGMEDNFVEFIGLTKLENHKN